MNAQEAREIAAQRFKDKEEQRRERQQKQKEKAIQKDYDNVMYDIRIAANNGEFYTNYTGQTDNEIIIEVIKKLEAEGFTCECERYTVSWNDESK